MSIKTPVSLWDCTCDCDCGTAGIRDADGEMLLGGLTPEFAEDIAQAVNERASLLERCNALQAKQDWMAQTLAAMSAANGDNVQRIRDLLAEVEQHREAEVKAKDALQKTREEKIEDIPPEERVRRVKERLAAWDAFKGRDTERESPIQAVVEGFALWSEIRDDAIEDERVLLAEIDRLTALVEKMELAGEAGERDGCR